MGGCLIFAMVPDLLFGPQPPFEQAHFPRQLMLLLLCTGDNHSRVRLVMDQALS
jgi:hypothetical protein